MKDIFELIDESKYKELVYFILIPIIATFVIEPIVILLFSIPYGGLGELKGQIVSMCGLVWWGGMDYSNYIFQPQPGDCNYITTTLWVGTPILFGISAILIGYLRKIFRNIELEHNFKRTLLYFFGIIFLVSIYRVLIGYDQDYQLFPDGIIYGLNLVLVGYRMFSVSKK